MYQATVFPHDIPTALSLMSSSIQRPVLDPEELEAQKLAAAYEIREIWAKPEMILPELVHTVAYKDNTLGMPLLCPEERLDDITSETLRGYMRDWYKPERMVIAGVGMEHEELVQLATQHFGDMTSPTMNSSRNLHNSGSVSHPALSKSFATLQPDTFAPSADYQALASARARYTGGQLMIERPEEEFTHVYVAFEGLGIHDPDIVSVLLISVPRRVGICLYPGWSRPIEAVQLSEWLRVTTCDELETFLLAAESAKVELQMGKLLAEIIQAL
jgi:processing peptidase subunit alpha